MPWAHSGAECAELAGVQVLGRLEEGLGGGGALIWECAERLSLRPGPGRLQRHAQEQAFLFVLMQSLRSLSLCD